MAQKKSTGKSTTKRGGKANLVAPWKPGQSGNPKGYKPGQRNFSTLFRIALERIAENANKPTTPEQVEEMMHIKAVEQVIKRGDFFFYKEMNERIHGKVTEKMDLTSKGKSLADIILAANNAKKTTKRGAK